ncbi:solute carrier family 2, facilitated glucose transporter member 1-like [Aplysia californica]|uniref:Solute carrier family 2, facilitated glucose transporter member 1-like n=1 Tax=Aplysia californica TaxID=6500 RepID=A0ABM1W3M4_APLCA|nr:solute carrier family 2, facilitated glucose transporter member 1-like [Aplysia californica]
MASYSNGDNAECSVVTKSPMKKLSVSPTAQEGRQNVTVRLCLSVLGAVLGSFQFGYNTGVINAPESSIKSFMNQTEWERSGESMTEEKGTNLFALIVAIFAAGGCLGGLAAGWWADFFGRKVGLLTNTTFGIVAAVLMYFSRLAGAYEMIIVGRFLVGINCGLYTGLTPLYLSEIASSDIRGALGVLHQLGVVLGILLSQVLGFQELLGNTSSWEVLMGQSFLATLC